MHMEIGYPRGWRTTLRTTAALVISVALVGLNGCIGSGNMSGSAAPTQNSQGLTVKNAFGFNIHNALQHWPPMPFTYWRLWDATVDWPRVEPSRGTFDFTLLDQYMALAQQKNVQVIYVLGNTPQWAATNPQSPSNEGLPGASSTLTNVQDWRDFVEKVATRYKGQIFAYEVWNEADLQGYWTGSVSDMLQLAQIAYTSIKQIDPSAIVLAPSLVAGNGRDWLQQYLAAGGNQFTDGVAYHLYTTSLAPEDAVPFMQSVLAIARQYNLPVWDTEVGFGPWGTLSDSDSAAYLARTLILHAANGITRTMWYAWDDRGPWVHLYLVEADLETPTLAGIAFAQVTNWLQAASVSCTNDATDLSWQCTLQTSDGSTKYIVWNYFTPETFAVPPSWQVSRAVDVAGSVTNIRGGQVNIAASPILLEP